MGQQHRVTIKRKRRSEYNKRKKIEIRERAVKTRKPAAKAAAGE
jgi:hypothetical protein